MGPLGPSPSDTSPVHRLNEDLRLLIFKELMIIDKPALLSATLTCREWNHTARIVLDNTLGPLVINENFRQRTRHVLQRYQTSDALRQRVHHIHIGEWHAYDSERHYLPRRRKRGRTSYINPDRNPWDEGQFFSPTWNASARQVCVRLRNLTIDIPAAPLQNPRYHEVLARDLPRLRQLCVRQPLDIYNERPGSPTPGETQISPLYEDEFVLANATAIFDRYASQNNNLDTIVLFSGSLPPRHIYRDGSRWSFREHSIRVDRAPIPRMPDEKGGPAVHALEVQKLESSIAQGAFQLRQDHLPRLLNDAISNATFGVQWGPDLSNGCVQVD
ncbi:hypothetical protein AMS68_004130 [Peltaster fructicola]|uniref:F-box domain-containing protein n=1 Tax=Peltaster fructicola TaxID=286661 RepID=A0A6H0XV48_9PEZI|nr:hypothetical protein AMS68_004130 [Peltaster fructicola]